MITFPSYNIIKLRAVFWRLINLQTRGHSIIKSFASTELVNSGNQKKEIFLLNRCVLQLVTKQSLKTDSTTFPINNVTA